MDARLQSPGEEIANSLIHGVALIAVAIAVPVLIVTAVRHGGAVNVAGASVFATTMILLYLTSTVYHALPASRAKRLLLRLDHGTIYLFIAGSYTPFALGVLGGPLGLDAVRTGVGTGRVRCCAQGIHPIRAPHRVDRTLFGHGLAGADRGGPARRADTGPRCRIARCRRFGLYGRRRVLRPRFATALRARDMAPLRHRRHRLPLFAVLRYAA